MRQLIILLIVISCSACETTGDPNQGGLWRWSKDKAITRQKVMEQQVNQLSSDNQKIEIQNQQLKYKNSKLQDEERVLKGQLNELIVERNQLLEQIEQFNIDKADKHSRLSSLTKQYHLGQIEDSKLSDQFDLLNNADGKKKFLHGIEVQNQRLTDEIILLLGESD